jgi:hypothetical protein
MTGQEMKLQIAIEQGKVNALRQEVAEMNKEHEYWQQVRIQAAIAAMSIVKDAYNVYDEIERFVHHSVRIADALIQELKGGEE